MAAIADISNYEPNYLLDKDTLGLVAAYMSDPQAPRSLSQKVNEIFDKIVLAWTFKTHPKTLFPKTTWQMDAGKIAIAVEWIRSNRFDKVDRLLKDRCFSQPITNLEEHPRYIFLKKSLEILRLELKDGGNREQIQKSLSRVISMIADRDLLVELYVRPIRRRWDGTPFRGQERSHQQNRLAFERKRAIEELLIDAAKFCCEMDHISMRDQGVQDEIIGLEKLFEFDETHLRGESMSLWKIARTAKARNCDEYLHGWLCSDPPDFRGG